MNKLWYIANITSRSLSEFCGRFKRMKRKGEWRIEKEGGEGRKYEAKYATRNGLVFISVVAVLLINVYTFFAITYATLRPLCATFLIEEFRFVSKSWERLFAIIIYLFLFEVVPSLNNFKASSGIYSIHLFNVTNKEIVIKHITPSSTYLWWCIQCLR